jgi:hypothetical protein
MFARMNMTSASVTRTTHEEEAVYRSGNDSLTYPTESVVTRFAQGLTKRGHSANGSLDKNHSCSCGLI